MVSDQGLDGSGVPDGWHPDGIMAGVPAMNAAAGQSTLGAVMTPAQIAQVDWNSDEAPEAAVAINPSQVTSSQGGDAGALTQDLQSLDPRLAPKLAGMQWVAVPNSVDQDAKANIDPDRKPRGYPDRGCGSDLTYGDLGGSYDPKTGHVILATDGGNAGDSSYNTVFHETAHGMDGPDAMQSGSADFQKAYNADKLLMTPGEDDYYLKDSGPNEAFAESFARYFGGDPTLQQDWPSMYEYWNGQVPNVSPGQPWKWSEQ